MRQDYDVHHPRGPARRQATYSTGPRSIQGAGLETTYSIGWDCTRLLGSGWVEAPAEAGDGN